MCDSYGAPNGAQKGRARLELRRLLLFVWNQLDQAPAQLFRSDTDEVALTGFEKRLLATDEFANTLLQESSEAERTTNLLHECLWKGLIDHIRLLRNGAAECYRRP